jgi:alpha-mannosidase
LAPIVIGDRTLTSDHVFVRIDERGELAELIVDGKAIGLHPGAGGMYLYPDRPANFEAWDIDRQSLSLGQRVATPPDISSETEMNGLRAAWVVRRTLGSAITVIAKPDVGHHPHSLSDPTPLLKFILTHVSASGR